MNDISLTEIEHLTMEESMVDWLLIKNDLSGVSTQELFEIALPILYRNFNNY